MSRPVHLDLTKMQFPLIAIVSILHRISGVLLFLLLPLALYLLYISLQSPVDFAQLHHLTSLCSVKFLMWALACAVCFHFLAGLRHMLMDCGLFESLLMARFTAYFVIVLEIAAMIFVGVWLW